MELNKKTFIKNIAGRDLKIEVSRLAEQTDAAVFATYGGTTVLVTTVMGKADRAVDYMPLTVDYEEKFYAAGKIIGSRFVRREGRPSEDAILSGRLVDRAIRPLFDQRLRRDIQVVVTILSIDEVNEPDFIALMAASTALAISDIPWAGPIAGVKMAKIGDRIVVNPSHVETTDNPEVRFESFVAGLNGKINMLELEANEANEKDIIEAYAVALKEIEGLIDFQKEIIKAIGKEKADVKLAEPAEELKSAVSEFLADKLEEAVYVREKADREKKLGELEDEMAAHLSEKGFGDSDIGASASLFNKALDELVHKNILEKEMRPDGRKLDEVRDLYTETGLLPRTHGSAVFIRGNTQALAVTTLAAPGAEQLIETMEYSGKRRFMLHYNFPPYSVGETGSYRGPGRRDIGHGALAEKALRPLIPSQDEFPYTIRVVSEILSSNGSSSMATVCAGSMSLMDAGVPIRKPAAGIAMGLMSNEKGDYKILTDIQGPEDHHGDMDFKVAGTRDGVNAVQMDVKIWGITLEIAEKTLAQAREARLRILDAMEKAIKAPKPELSPYAPQVIVIHINPEKIGEVIGPGGKMINGIIERTGALSIDIEQTGKVFVAADNKDSALKAVAEIEALTKEYQVGEIVEGTVVRLLDFGAIVDLGGGRDGMIHISEFKDGFVKNINDVAKIGDFLRAKVIRVEDGKIALSVKQLSTQSA
ncbi:MAG: polyribonucleotide nucleotidyltransferase [Patescibacteria group bacterium]|nr:polyribonucleotide nucleotidyltransferase [Patescibacteria group bacterium]MCL5262193.1 polyribonucleotide nucleotidyltransferase [Patescibacteria group bacterium]